MKKKKTPSQRIVWYVARTNDKANRGVSAYSKVPYKVSRYALIIIYTLISKYLSFQWVRLD